MVSLEDILPIKGNQDFYKNSKQGSEVASGKKGEHLHLRIFQKRCYDNTLERGHSEVPSWELVLLSTFEKTLA